MKKKNATNSSMPVPAEPGDDAFCGPAWDYEAERFEKNLELEQWMEEWVQASRAGETG
jgi:hypothetical protein